MWYKCNWLLELSNDTAAFIAACMRVPVGLNRLATVWNSDPSACSVTYFDCIIVTVSQATDASDLNVTESKRSLTKCLLTAPIFSSECPFFQTSF